MATSETPPDTFAQSFAEDALSTALSQLIRRLAPGDRLPAERDLAVRLGVSRTALRDRLGVLEGLGMLRRRTGSGTYVSALRPATVGLALNLAISSSQIPLNHLESVRIALERQAAAEAARHREPAVAELVRSVEEMSTAPDLTGILRADQDFHRALLRASQNPSLEFFADALSGLLAEDLTARARRFDASSSTAARELLVGRHAAIHEAIGRGDPLEAMRTVDRHFDALPTPD